MARKRFYLPKPKKCPTTRKTMFETEKEASYAMMRTWAHDSKMDIYNYHTYLCPTCRKYHFGDKTKYEKRVKNAEIEITDTVSLRVP